jgi:DNA-binding transcriptional ArsR family regulator/uncharacterized protein YndB with AHSA1/START domain
MTERPPAPSPTATAPEMDAVFKALADPSRRQLLDRLNAQSGQTLRELCAGLDMARQSVSKHLAVLEAAALVVTVRQGREKLHYLNAAPITEISERWINRYDQPRVDALSNLKQALETPPMTRPAFVYVTYINTTPERLWQGLTEPAFMQSYWGLTLESSWAVGAPITWHQSHDVTIADPDQVVLVYEPYERLSYTWHTFTQEWAEAQGVDEDRRAALVAETRTKVTFELEPIDSMVKLTVVHDDFDDDSLVATMVSQGWPRVMSALKTMMETSDQP